MADAPEEQFRAIERAGRILYAESYAGPVRFMRNLCEFARNCAVLMEFV